jgi:CBS domain-containing protein
MTTVGDILNAKGTKTWSVRPDVTVLDALRLMSEQEIGAVMVIDETGAVRGIMSERDYARKVSLHGKSPRETLVADIMTPRERMYAVTPASTLEDCMVMMTARHVRHLPVFDGVRFVGLISIGDVVKDIISEKEALIEQLQDFIARA